MTKPKLPKGGDGKSWVLTCSEKPRKTPRSSQKLMRNAARETENDFKTEGAAVTESPKPTDAAVVLQSRGL